MGLLPWRTVGGTDASSEYGNRKRAVLPAGLAVVSQYPGGYRRSLAEPSQRRGHSVRRLENFGQAPRDDILKAPVFAALTCPAYINVQLPLFPNLGPVMQEQLGLNAEEGEREAAREVDQVIFHQPGIMYFVGADLESVRESLAGQEFRDFDRVYWAAGEDGDGRRIATAEFDGVPVMTVIMDNFSN